MLKLCCVVCYKSNWQVVNVLCSTKRNSWINFNTQYLEFILTIYSSIQRSYNAFSLLNQLARTVPELLKVISYFSCIISRNTVPWKLQIVYSLTIQQIFSIDLSKLGIHFSNLLFLRSISSVSFEQLINLIPG